MTFSDDHVAFALRCHRALVGEAPATTSAWSPYSVASALGMLAAGDTADAGTGALGAAGTGLVKLVCPSAGLDALRDALAAAARPPGEPPRRDTDPAAMPGLAVANRLWLGEGRRSREDYAAELARWPGSRVGGVPFARDPAAAARTINDDVAETTRGLVPRVLPEGALGPDTRAVLAGALWLRAGWAHRFATSATRDGTFHGEAGDRTVAMMRASDASVRLAETPTWRLVGLPAAGGQVVVDLLLPAGRLAGAPLAEAERTLDAGTVHALTGAATRSAAHLTMPRFRIEASFGLEAPLRGLGIDTLFGGGSGGLRGVLANGEPLFVSRADHACVLRVDEAGVEGAAATAVTMVRAALVRGTARIVVDRPFLLLVRDTATGAVYFMARVTDVT